MLYLLMLASSGASIALLFRLADVTGRFLLGQGAFWQVMAVLLAFMLAIMLAVSASGQIERRA